MMKLHSIMKRLLGDCAPPAQKKFKDDATRRKQLCELIFSELESARREGRDFKFSREDKQKMLQTYGHPMLCSVLFQAIRETGTHVADALGKLFLILSFLIKLFSKKFF